MALIQKKDMVSPISLRYTIGTPEVKKLIVGLGNPGEEYELTRHNLGFMVIDQLAEKYEVTFVTKKDLKSQVAVIMTDNGQLILAKPQTFMNNSGEAVRALIDYYKIPLSSVLITYDELDIPFGDLRPKLGGGAAGHNGIKSIIKHCTADFHRLRIGIGPKTPEQMDSADFVLQKFSAPQRKKLPAILAQAIEKIDAFLS